MLCDKTDGWVSGLILFCHTLTGKSPADIDTTLSKLKGSTEIISNYLEENVYDSLSEEKKTFLTKTSILSELNSDFCNKYLHIDNAQKISRISKRATFLPFPLMKNTRLFIIIIFFKSSYNQSYKPKSVKNPSKSFITRPLNCMKNAANTRRRSNIIFRHKILNQPAGS